MIFPELPRRHREVQRTRPLVEAVIEAPLYGVEIVPAEKQLDVDEWFRQHGLAPEDREYRRSDLPIDWSARDAVEFYVLCVFMIAWTVYWYGSHRGIW